MIDETLQDQAALYVLRLLPPQEALEFAKEADRNAELSALVAEFEDSATALVNAMPQQQPPAELKARVMNAIRDEQRATTPARPAEWLPWALAAGLALNATAMWFENNALKEQNTSQQAKLAELTKLNTFANVRIATLSAKVTAYEKAAAVVVFDDKAQRGLVKLDSFPAAASGKDYQLWLIESGNPAPVSAGVVPVGRGGVAKVSFRPTRHVTTTDAFAISVEPAGGSAAPQGEIVFVGK